MDDLDEEVTLTNYEDNFLRRMNTLRKENRYCDVSFNVGGKEFHCHKLVLVTASSYFETMFNGNFSESSSQRNITLKEIEPEALEEILTAIYTTRFRLKRDNAYFLLKASHMLMLTEVLDTIVTYIKKNTNIDYLIETCLFAKSIEQNSLYSICISAIASDLENLSKTDLFNKKITFPLFETILMDENLLANHDEVLLRIIMSWNRLNNRNKHEIMKLIDAADIKSTTMSAPMMANYIVLHANNIEDAIEDSIKSSCGTNEIGRSLPFKDEVYHEIYLNAVNVNTGTKGWATLQSEIESNEYEIVNFQPSNFLDRKIKKIGNQVYCFEYDYDTFSFYCVENGQKTNLATPPRDLCTGECFDIEPLNNFVYLISSHEKLWVYSRHRNEWLNVGLQKTPVPRFENNTQRYQHYNHNFSRSLQEEALWCQTAKKRPSSTALSVIKIRPHYTSPKLTSCDGQLCIVGVESNGKLEIVIITPTEDGLSSHRTEYTEKISCPYEFCNPAVCCYEKKLIINGSNHNDKLHKTTFMYDIEKKSWYELPEMNCGRANHSLNYFNGLLYATENKPMVSNEKYDVSLEKWLYIPPLPQRMHFPQENITLATGDVLHCAIRMAPTHCNNSKKITKIQKNRKNGKKNGKLMS